MAPHVKTRADRGTETLFAGSAPEARPVDPEESALVARAREGDGDAFDAIVRLHLPHVWSVVWRFVRHREDAEDVVQEVFVAAFKGLPGYRGDARLSTWLHRIAVSRALNHLDRREEKMRRSSSPLPDESEMTNGAAGPATGWGTTSPLQALEARDLQRRLAECLSRLPAAWRAVLTLRDVDAHSYEAIAAVLDLAIGTVRSRLSRARLSLRRCIAERT